MNYLLTGASGLLGKEIQKYLDCYTPTSEEMDITKITDKHVAEYINAGTIIHAAAFTDVLSAEMEKEKCFKVNVQGTKNLLNKFNKKMVYISSEDVYHPVNFYAQTKLMAEQLVKQNPENLIIRTSFVARPFPYKDAFFDRFTRGDYVDVIAPMIVTEILKGTRGIIDIGTERKTNFELARQTRPLIKAISVKDIPIPLPNDYEL